MPTYEYKCLDCDHRFEVFQKMTDEPLAECEECGGSVKRLVGTGAGIIFKGSGFYCTDYRSPSYQAAKKEDKAGSDSGSGNKKSSSGSAKPDRAEAAVAKGEKAGS